MQRNPTSANQKIVSTNRKLGIKGIGNQQGTTRIIYDCTKLATSANPTTLTLFKGCQNRTFPLTNLTENKLQVGESIALQRMSCFIVECTTGTTNVIGLMPLLFFPQFERLYRSDMDFQIGQSVVIKQMPLHSMYAPFNHHSQFFGNYSNQTFAAGAPTSDFNGFKIPQDVYHFENDIIIPPQIEFFSTIQINPITLPSGADFYFCMSLEGLGSLFSPKANF